MMLRTLFLPLAFAASTVLAAAPGQSAPEISLPATDGKPARLSDHKGKWVVLEWVNPGCPYVRKHYDSKNMQALQKTYGGKDVVWLAVNSTNPGHADYLKPAAMGDWMKGQGGTPRATLMDEKGVAGRAYGARTTPQMFIIDPKGQVVYNGAIDDKRSANPEDVKTAKNFLKAGMDEALAGKPVSTASTTPYGCTVKY
ncbi:MAG: thioredoxin family protein [Burkholderiales bacterium]|nr:thioredoxin family protein [Burkholderiales bacterium]